MTGEEDGGRRRTQSGRNQRFYLDLARKARDSRVRGNDREEDDRRKAADEQYGSRGAIIAPPASARAQPSSSAQRANAASSSAWVWARLALCALMPTTSRW